MHIVQSLISPNAEEILAWDNVAIQIKTGMGQAWKKARRDKKHNKDLPLVKEVNRVIDCQEKV